MGQSLPRTLKSVARASLTATLLMFVMMYMAVPAMASGATGPTGPSGATVTPSPTPSGATGATGATGAPSPSPSPSPSVTPAPSPTIASDKEDYAPGETVTITGAGWPAQDAITVQTDDSIGKTWSDTGQVTSDADGNFSYSFALSTKFVASYSTTASDASGLSATTTFTDAPAAFAVLEGQSCTNPCNGAGDGVWFGGPLLNWQELLPIPMRVLINAGNSDVNKTFHLEIKFDHTKTTGGVPDSGIDSLASFSATGPVDLTNALLSDTTGDQWGWTFDIKPLAASSNDNEYITFLATMAAGARAFTGSSLAVTGVNPISGQMQFQKPAPLSGHPDLYVNKTGPTAAGANQQITYTLHYGNLATDPADAGKGVQLKDFLPAGVIYVSGCDLADGCSMSGNTLTWTFPNSSPTWIPANSGDLTKTIVVTTPNTTGNITNVATIASGNDDSNANNNSSQLTTAISTNAPPSSPTSLGQFKSDGVTVIAVGGATNQTTVIFKGTVSDPNADQTRLQVEVEPVGTPFTNTVSATSSAVASGGTASVTVNTGLTNGTSYHWQARAIDASNAPGTWSSFGGNAETAADFTIDTTGPTVTLTKVNGNTVSFPFTTNANVTSVGGACTTGDGDVSVQLGANPTVPATATCAAGAWTLTLTTALSAEATYSFLASQTDGAGNGGNSGSKTVTIDKSTTTTVESDNNPSTYGDSVTFTATISAAAGDPGANGTVTFKAGGSAISGCSDVALNASSKATCTTSTLDVPDSPHSITAVYSGATSAGKTWLTSTSSVLSQVVDKKGQTITFVQPTTPRTYGDTFNVNPTSDSGLSVDVAASGGCSVASAATGYDVTMTSGTTDCVLTASQDGNANYSAATDVVRTVSAQKKASGLVFDLSTLPAKTYGDAPFSVTSYASSDSPAAITFALGTGSVGCTVTSAGQVTITGAAVGSDYCKIEASQVATPNYQAGGPISQSFHIAKKAPTLVFDLSTLPAKTYGDAAFDVSGYASSNSPGAITFALGASSVGCTVTSAGMVTITGAAVGSDYCVIAASQVATPNYTAGGPISQSFHIAKANQTITLNGVPSSADYGDGPFTITATATSGLAVTIATSGPCSFDASTGKLSLSTSAIGVCTVTASQAGDGNYLAAPQLQKSFTISARTGTVAYIGQTLFMTSGSSSTTVQAALSASVVSDAGSIANAKVTFTNLLTSPPTVLAKGVKVSPVSGSTVPTGTANTIVTLSTGKYGVQSYLIQVKLDTAAGSTYFNDAQLADATSAAYATLTAMIPPTTNSMQGDATIGSSGVAPAGTYRDASGVHYSVGLQYNKSGTNPQGQIMLTFPRTGGMYYVKSNSITSLACTVIPTGTNPCKDLTVYTKASIYKVDPSGVVTSIEGNVTLRMDAHDGGASNDTIGFTVLSSKDGSLYYSNNWVYDSPSKSWRTVQQGVSNNGSAVVIN
jgi:hypothetical protein